jgi:hypothetical protein
MFPCAVIVIVVIAFSTFGDLRDMWHYPDHRPASDNSHHAKPHR